MSDDRTVVAEVKSFGDWVPVDLETALRQPRTRAMRCPECHGYVRAHNASSSGMRAHMEHEMRNAGCSRGDCFDGDRRPHPRQAR